MKNYFVSIIEKVENYPTNLYLWAISFIGIIFIRLLTEVWLDNFESRSGIWFFYEFAHTFLFFLLAFITFLLITKTVIKEDTKKISNVLLFGYLIIFTPAIIDYVISEGKGYWSFYKFDSLVGLFERFFTFFGDKPWIGITYGVRIEVIVVIVFLFFYAVIKKKSIIRSLGLAFFAYVAFFILGTFPSWITVLVEGFGRGFFNVNESHVVGMFLTPFNIFSQKYNELSGILNAKMSLVYALILPFVVIFLSFKENKKKMLSFLRNSRFPQIIHHIGLLIIGMGLGFAITDASLKLELFHIVGFLVLVQAIVFAWISSVVFNDIFDEKIDEISNKNRPLIKQIFVREEYLFVGVLLLGASILFASIVNVKIALLLFVYHALAWVYSANPLRLKRFAFISTFIMAIASVLIMIIGFIFVSPAQDITILPSAIVWFLIIGYTFLLPMKDLKDIEGDGKDGVYTIPVIFGEYWGKTIIGSGAFLFYIVSVIALNEFSLFWWAIVFGGISFWVISFSKKEGRLNYRNLIFWIITLVVLYEIILVKIVF